MTNLRWSRRPRGLAARTPRLQAVAESGADRAMTPGELSAVARRDARAVQSCWSAYERQWARFCGAHLDPQFWQLEHPAMLTGAPMIDDSTPVVVVGTGPSLVAGLHDLRRHRDGVYLFTSPRGVGADRASIVGTVRKEVFSRGSGRSVIGSTQIAYARSPTAVLPPRLRLLIEPLENVVAGAVGAAIGVAPARCKVGSPLRWGTARSVRPSARRAIRVGGRGDRHAD